jgi:3-dehydroquinate synthetase
MDKWIELSELQSYLIQDKKNSNSNIHFVKVAGIGKVDSTFSLTLNQLKKLNLNELISKNFNP